MQNLTGRRVAVLVLPEPTWSAGKAHLAEVAEAANAMRPGEYRELAW